MTNQQEKEYSTLLDLLFRVSGETKSIDIKAFGISDPNWFRDAEGLGVKFAFHSTSILYLSRGTVVRDFPLVEINFTDFASIIVLARAAFESFLTFHHVFVAPKSNQLKDFRYSAWLLSGMCERQKFIATKSEHRRQKENERKQITEILKKLYSSPEFNNLRKDQKTKIRTGQWRLYGWKKLAKDARLNELHASIVYGYLCGYAHSDSLSVLQVHDAKSREQQARLSRLGVRNTMIATANMVFLYCDVFPDGKRALAKNPKAMQIAEAWRDKGRGK